MSLPLKNTWPHSIYGGYRPQALSCVWALWSTYSNVLDPDTIESFHSLFSHTQMNWAILWALKCLLYVECLSLTTLSNSSFKGSCMAWGTLRIGSTCGMAPSFHLMDISPSMSPIPLNNSGYSISMLLLNDSSVTH